MGLSGSSRCCIRSTKRSLQRNRLGEFHQADETRWLVFVLLDGKKGHGWWLWVILGADTVIYLLDASRSHEVPQSHFGPDASGVLEVDRYSGYKAMAKVKSGLMVLAFCWAHVRRDFVGVGKGWAELVPWALCWMRRIRDTLPLESGTSASSSRLRARFKSKMPYCVRRWRRCVPKRRESFPISNSANHAARFWRACKSTGRD